MAFFPPNFLYQMQQSPIDENHPFLPTMQQDLRAMIGKRSPMDFEEVGGEDELSDDSQAGERKRRLNLEQVRTLEKNFEIGNKLEPERKMQLAHALGLQPRQIAIWFQNRRARWKTKKLEKDYESLKRQFDVVKAENDELHEQNKKLQAELFGLRSREAAAQINLNKEMEGSSSNGTENSADINLDISRTQAAAGSPPNLPRGIAFFPSHKQQALSQLIQSSAKPELHEENLCNIFGSMDDQSSFWAWSDQQNFH